MTPEELRAQEITDAFEALYQGENGRAGLKSLETLLPSRQVTCFTGTRVQILTKVARNAAAVVAGAGATSRPGLRPHTLVA